MRLPGIICPVRMISAGITAILYWSGSLTLIDCDPEVDIIQNCPGEADSDPVVWTVPVDGTPPQFLIIGGPGDGRNISPAGVERLTFSSMAARAIPDHLSPAMASPTNGVAMVMADTPHTRWLAATPVHWTIRQNPATTTSSWEYRIRQATNLRSAVNTTLFVRWQSSQG